VTTGAKSTSRTPKNKEIFFADPGQISLCFSGHDVSGVVCLGFGFSGHDVSGVVCLGFGFSVCAFDFPV
jgi:hypothetical protein